MPDTDILLNTAPENISQNPGATGLSDPPASITGALAEYASRPQPAANSLGLLMDDQQMRDAGVHPEQSGAQPAYSVIDATGAGGPKADLAGGYAKVARVMRQAVTGAHATASSLGQAPIIHAALRAGQKVGPAMAEAASHPVIAGLNTLNRIYSVPLYAAESVAQGVNDLRNRPADLDAITGDAIRGMVVTGTGVASPILAGVADKYLPDGPAMGQAYHQSFVDTDGRPLLLP